MLDISCYYFFIFLFSEYENYKSSQNEAENSLLFNSTKCYLESTEIKINDISKNEKPSGIYLYSNPLSELFNSKCQITFINF